MTDLTISFKKVQGSEIESWVNSLAQLRIEIFRDWPYIYDGDMDYERTYLNRYAQTKNAFISMAFKGTELIGATTGLPLAEESHPELVEPFLQNGFRRDEVFYFGESVLKKNFRGLGIGAAFMQHREDFARQFSPITTLSFCAVQRSENHPLRPPAYRPLDPFWKSRGFEPHPMMKCEFSWKDLHENQETSKTMIFWTKKIK